MQAAVGDELLQVWGLGPEDVVVELDDREDARYLGGVPEPYGQLALDGEVSVGAWESVAPEE